MKLSFSASNGTIEQKLLEKLVYRYAGVAPNQADIIVVIGSNAAVIRALHRFHACQRPIFPLNPAHTGFLTNDIRPGDLEDRLREAVSATLSPLKAEWITTGGRRGEIWAFNEVALFRQTRRMTHIGVVIEGCVRLNELIGDGILLATPAGSTAYNLSVKGPILPLGVRLLALTPIAPFRPRRWRGALLPDRTSVDFRIIRPKLRPTSLTADFSEVRNIAEVTVSLDETRQAVLLFDADHSFAERNLREQFKK